MASQVAKGLKRSTINKYRKDCLTMFGWGVPKKLIPTSVVDTLKYVRGLQPGRPDAVESEGVQAVAGDVVEATIAQAHPVIAGMIRFQRLTGSRPTEICILRSSRIDKTDADIWVYFPEYWKTQLTAKKKDRRAIMIDEKLQDPDAVKAATNEYQQESDKLPDWIADRCVESPAAITKANDLYVDYRDWCKQTGNRP
jgi:integrase